MDERDISRLAYMRMRIDVVGRPVGCPARVSDAGITPGGVGLQLILERLNLPFSFFDIQRAIHQSDTRRIVTAVFQPFKSFDNNIARLFVSYISNNSTHKNSLKLATIFYYTILTKKVTIFQFIILTVILK